MTLYDADVYLHQNDYNKVSQNALTQLATMIQECSHDKYIRPFLNYH